ncbi:hypothetical protein [Streptomyces sp. NPDC055912]|uniref:hypothetical protein n=1 Tax=Streptomyces sp. NPDC055912 TaxID=3345660 RepID=UPI0035D79CFC
MRGHDITAAAALRAVSGLSLPERLVQAGFGPQVSVVGAAVGEAGWVRCAGCAYAGPPAGLAAHVRGSGCAGAPAAAEGAQEVAEEAGGGAAPAAGAGRGDTEGVEPAAAVAERSGKPAGPPVRAAAGAAEGLLLPATDDPLWGDLAPALRQKLTMAAHRLVTPPRGPLQEKAQRRLVFALRAAGRGRMSGQHWQALLSAPREVLGSARSTRAAAVYEVLEEVVAGHLAPADDDAAPTGPAVPEGPGTAPG